MNRQYTVADAIQIANSLSKSELCLDAIGTQSVDTVLTLQERDALVEKLLDDSVYGAG